MRARERCARAAPREGVARAREGVAREPVRGRGRGETRVDPFASSAPRTREATRAREAENVADAREAYGAWDDVEVFEVPATLRRDGAARNERFVEHVVARGTVRARARRRVSRLGVVSHGRATGDAERFVRAG